MAGDPFGDLPRSHYGAIMADPPWFFRPRTDFVSKRDPRHHYNGVMSGADICALPVRDLAAKDAHLFIWTTGPCLRQTFDVIEAWGFKYSGVAFTWVKLKRSHNPMQLRLTATSESDLHVGLGFTTRKNAEFCLLARRGSARREAKNIREIILSPVREHSRKPDEAFERVQRYCVGPYLDLFSRQPRPGWDGWGNETTKFAEAAE